MKSVARWLGFACILLSGGAFAHRDDSLQDNVSSLASSSPINEARDAGLSDPIVLHFAQRVDPASLNSSTVTLLGPDGANTVAVSVDSSGLQAEVRTARDRHPGTRYTLLVDGAKAANGAPIPLVTLAFTTVALNADGSKYPVQAAEEGVEGMRSANTAEAASSSIGQAQPRVGCDSAKAIRSYQFCHDAGSTQDGIFSPGFNNTDGRWRTNVPLPKLPSLADFKANSLPAGTTSLFGVARRVDDKPLVNVTISAGKASTKTDANGRFLLRDILPGHQQLIVDGASANRSGEEYGQFVAAVDIKAHQTNALPYNLFIPRITARDKISLPSPTTSETVITHPAIPGLEIHIPAGAVVRDRTGKVLTEIAIVPMPVDRAPVPVPSNFQSFFSAQPGGATIDGLTASAASGLKTVYPNYTNEDQLRSQFYYYDAEGAGWTTYSAGQVSTDGKSVTAVTAWGARTFMPQGFGNIGSLIFPDRQNKTCKTKSPEPLIHLGDPVDCSTGDFLHSAADLSIQDLMPLQFEWTYNSNDTVKHSLGRGAMMPYDMYIYVPTQGCVTTYQYAGSEFDLVTEDGSVYPFFLPPGKKLSDNVPAIHNSSPTKFYGATLSVSEGGIITIQLTDGTRFRFSATCPSTLLSITDRFGNTISVANTAGLITGLTSPSGRSLSIAYNGNNLISSVTDSASRSMSFAYNTSNELTTATFADGTTEQYTYDTNGNMLTVKDRRGSTMVTNQYDGTQRVSQQTYADGSTYQFAYTASGNMVSATDVTDGRGYVKHIAFDGQGYPTSITRAYGTPFAQTTTYTRTSGELISNMVDALGRTTSMTYDAAGDALTKTFMTGAADAATYAYTYTSDYHQVASVTDPLGHSINYTYNGGCLASITDPLGHATSIISNGSCLPTSVQDALGHTTAFSYRGSDLASITDALNRTTSFTLDGLGRRTAVRDPLGRLSRMVYDANGHVSQSIDPLNQPTAYAYDGNGNLTSVTDPNGGTTHFAYDSRNHRISRSDALGQSESTTYDAMGNVLTTTDRKGQQTTYQYDALNRPSLVTYADSSTVTPTFDAGNRLTQVVDSISGTITRSYDDFDRMTQEQTPQGVVNYTYDALGRRTTMTPASQSTITYGYDNANRLTGITQATQNIDMTYDAANRRSTLTLPNGIVTTYSYDNADQVTGITYATAGGTTLASLTYTYDAAGQRTSRTGGFGADLLPTPTTATNTFDLNNRQSLWNGFSLDYDFNGDPTSNASTTPTTSYVFDARHQLTQIQQNGSTIASFAYDTFGRRTSKTISGTTTSFLYDGANAVQETQGTSISAILTGLGIDERFSRDDAIGKVNYLVDALGSTIALADGSGTVQQTYSYEPFGEVSSTGTSTNPYQYIGKPNDGTGLYYFDARYYSPTLKRFISEDPIGLAGGLNAYAYVDNNPLNEVDPDGLSGIIQPAPEPYYGPGPAPFPPSHATPDDYRRLLAWWLNVWVRIEFPWMCSNRPKNPPDIGPPNGWVQGPRRGRQYGPSGEPEFDIDKPHQGNPIPHVHTWKDGEREEPGRPVSPVPWNDEKNCDCGN